MARQFIDNDLVLWEVYASTGQFGLPTTGQLVFLCATDRTRRPRTVRYQGDLVEAEAALMELSDQQLRELLAKSQEIK
ncbi:MAG TPA: hypothetical protein VF167_13390 [Longimicrobiaceae bacterium]